MDVSMEGAVDDIQAGLNSIRIDKETNKGSAIDVARIATGLPSNDARKRLTTALIELGYSLPQLKINGKGHVRHAQTLAIQAPPVNQITNTFTAPCTINNNYANNGII